MKVINLSATTRKRLPSKSPALLGLKLIEKLLRLSKFSSNIDVFKSLCEFLRLGVKA